MSRIPKSTRVLEGRRILSLAAIAVIGVWAVSPARGADASPGDTAAPAARSADDLSLDEEDVAAKFRRFEMVLLRMSELTASSDPKRAALLRKTLAQGRERGIEAKFVRVIELLKNERLANASDGQRDVESDLKRLLKLLESEERGERVKDERERIKEQLKKLKELINRQSQIQGQTQNGGDAKSLADEQAKLADETAELARRMGTENSAESAESAEGSKPNESPEKNSAADKSADDKPSEQGEPKDISDKPPQDGDKSSEGDSRPMPGDKALDDKGEETPADSNSKEEEPSGKEPIDGDESPMGEKSDDGSKKPMEGDSPSDSDSNEPMEGDSGKPTKSPSEKSEPGEPPKGSPSSKPPKQGESPQRESPRGEKPDTPPPDQDSAPPSDDSQSPNQPTGRKRVQEAKDRMDDAQRKLEQAEREGAVKDQEEAKRNLEQAKAELEDILRQLREEELERVLQLLEARFRGMLAAQLEVYEGTKQAERAATSTGSADEIETGRLSRKEAAIELEAANAINVLKEEGSAVAFPEAVEQMLADIRQIVRLLAAAQVGETTQLIEEDIITALEEMIEALQKAQDELEKQKQQPSPPNQQPGSPQDQPLVDKIAELKLIRALQMRVNRRTQHYSKQVTGEIGQADLPEIIEALRELADREERVFRTTRDIVVGKNE